MQLHPVHPLVTPMVAVITSIRITTLRVLLLSFTAIKLIIMLLQMTIGATELSAEA